MKVVLYPYVDVERISYSFQDNSLDKILGIRLDGSSSVPKRIPPPLPVECPPGSELEGTPPRLKWVRELNAEQPPLSESFGKAVIQSSDANEVYKYAAFEVFGFRLAEEDHLA